MLVSRRPINYNRPQAEEKLCQRVWDMAVAVLAPL